MTAHQRARWAATIFLSAFALIVIGCDGSSGSSGDTAVDATPASSQDVATEESGDSGGGSHSR